MGQRLTRKRCSHIATVPGRDAQYLLDNKLQARRLLAHKKNRAFTTSPDSAQLFVVVQSSGRWHDAGMGYSSNLAAGTATTSPWVASGSLRFASRRTLCYGKQLQQVGLGRKEHPERAVGTCRIAPCDAREQPGIGATHSESTEAHEGIILSC